MFNSESSIADGYSESTTRRTKMKKTLILLLCVVMVFAMAACAGDLQQEEEQQAIDMPELQTENKTQETPQVQDQQEDGQQQDEEQSGQEQKPREDIMRDMLENPQWTAGENAELMAENSGGQFGDIAVKQPSEDGSSFQFISGDDGAYMSLNTRFKDFGGDGRAQQAFNMKFMTQDIGDLSFTLMGMGEVVVSFEDSGVFCTYVQSGMKISFSEYMPTSFILENEKWYNILLATDDAARLRVLVWEEGNYENQAFYQQDLYIGADDIYESNWKLTIGFGPNGTLNVEDYGVFMFDSFTENPPLADAASETISGLGFDQGNYADETEGLHINIQSMAWGGAEKDVIFWKKTMYDTQFGVEILYPERQYKIHIPGDKWYLYDPESSEVIEPWFDVEAELRKLVGDHADTISDELVRYINEYCNDVFGYSPDELIMMNYE